jgi:predicted nucleic-acid-binding Zn-ribbon protein
MSDSETERRPWIWRTKETVESHKFSIAGKAVRCLHCEHTEFVRGEAQLNTAGMTFLGFDWANRSAHTLTCANCGRIEWYLEQPEVRK